VILFEQAPKLEPIGAAISIWGNAMAGLDWLGCGDALPERAVRVRRLLLTQIDGRVPPAAGARLLARLRGGRARRALRLAAGANRGSRDTRRVASLARRAPDRQPSSSALHCLRQPVWNLISGPPLYSGTQSRSST